MCMYEDVCRCHAYRQLRKLTATSPKQLARKAANHQNDDIKPL